jgi:uracil-DNA glycosylase family 4
VGFSFPDGDGSYGVMIVGEALGENEEKAGMAFVGKSGHYLFNALNRVGLKREHFTISNVLKCRPPNNKLSGMPWERVCIKHCAPNLDADNARAREAAKANGRTFTILTLGKTAFMRIMGFEDPKDPFFKHDYINYPMWSQKYEAWVVATYHPAYLIRGYNHLIPVLQFAAKRAVEIAERGYEHEKIEYSLDPQPKDFGAWVDTFLGIIEGHDESEIVLSYDIETPFKKGKDEETVSKESDDDYTILRCSFSYRPSSTVSVPWTAEYIPHIERLFTSNVAKLGWNNENYDDPRVRAQMPFNGISIDGMLAWHVLNTSLPKALGFVTPFYAQNSSMWKHLADSEPAFYNAKDADMALRNYVGIREDLKNNDLWHVFDRHVIQLNKIFAYMRSQGVLLDRQMRDEAETKLAAELVGIKESMEAVLPNEVRKVKVYKKTPKSTDGLQKVVQVVVVPGCRSCGLPEPKAAHFKSIGKKKLKAGEPENPCLGADKLEIEVTKEFWAKPLEFKISNKAMQSYQKAVKHQAIRDAKKGTITFDEKAILRLLKKYPEDRMYPFILEHRQVQGLLSKYIGITENGRIRGGLTTDKDGVIKPTFTHNPSTLRSACQNPPLQQLPRPAGPDDRNSIIRNMIVARPGHIFLARDYSGIEAVLVGYFARLKDYIRLAKMDVHSFYTAYALHQLDGRISANDLPLLSWDDHKLAKRLGEIKSEFKKDRNSLYKHLVHGANFMQGPKGAAEKILLETGISYNVALVGRVMGVYFELFPGIKQWHKDVLAQADKDGFVRNPFGYVHRFSRVYDWEKVGGEWQKEPGPDANKVIAFGPQSTAAGIIKEAMLRLYFDRFEEAGQYLRLLIHDELFTEVPEELTDRVDAVMLEEMEKPIPELALPASYDMGPCLNILTEAKRGYRWGQMH